MKNLYISLLLFGTTLAWSQDVERSRSGFSVQTGVVPGIWINYEIRLNNSFTLRAEAGRSFSFQKIIDGAGSETPFTTEVGLGSRWYFSPWGRIKRNGKPVATRGFLYLSGKTRFDAPFTNEDGYSGRATALGIILGVGMNKDVGRHFVFEFGGGPAARYFLAEKEGWSENLLQPGFDLFVRLGYRIDI